MVIRIPRCDVSTLDNVLLGKYATVTVSRKIINNPRLNKYINESTMSALDNYANHEGMSISIAPLENDLFDDVVVHVHRRINPADSRFALKINESGGALGDFLKELYTNVAQKQEPEYIVKGEKPTFYKDLKLFIKDKSESVKNYRLNYIRKFIEKHESGSGILRLMADVLEEMNFNNLYK